MKQNVMFPLRNLTIEKFYFTEQDEGIMWIWSSCWAFYVRNFMYFGVICVIRVFYGLTFFF
jgi:hypothetical protein